MSDCLHCDIHEMLEDHLRGEQADLSEIADKASLEHPSLPGDLPPTHGEQLMRPVATGKQRVMTPCER